MCRHTVGLNWTGVGIEMVGTSDQQILGDPAQLRSAVRLTAWLMQRLHIRLRNVIGMGVLEHPPILAATL